MSSSTIKRLILVCTVAVGITALAVSSYADSTCKFRDGGCSLKVTINERTHAPYAPCQVGDLQGEVNMVAKCGSNSDVQTKVVCGSSSVIIEWTDSSGVTHKLVPVPGKTWEDAFNVACFNLTYKNNN